MALKLLAIRQRETGAEVSVLDDAGKERVFWKYGHKAGEAVPSTWYAPLVAAQVTAEAAIATKEATAASDAGTLSNGFLTWLKANKARADVRALLIALAKLYRNGGI